MEVFIVRHGIAQDAESNPGLPDSERALTAEGRKKTRQVALALKKLDCAPDLIASSPLLRARETAEILAKTLAPDLEIEETALLLPGADPADCARWLRTLSAQSVILVGHMPDVADLASAFLLKRPGLNIVFKKASVCSLAFDDAPALGAASLQWLMQPAQLLNLAKS